MDMLTVFNTVNWSFVFNLQDLISLRHHVESTKMCSNVCIFFLF